MFLLEYTKSNEKPNIAIAEYISERKLSSVKNPTGKKATAKQFISDIASVKDHQVRIYWKENRVETELVHPIT